MAKPVLVLDRFALAADGPLLNLELHKGEIYAVIGPAGGGKSVFLDTLVGDEAPACGSALLAGSLLAAEYSSGKGRQTPFGAAKAAARDVPRERISFALSALGLWEVRNEAMSKMPRSMLAACDLLPCLVCDDDIILIDGHLDLLDPWQLESTLEAMFQLADEGSAFMVATNRPDLAERFGKLIVFRDGEPIYAGSVQDLIDSQEPTEIVIETDDLSTVRSMVEPFALGVRASGNKLIVTAEKGQELAARLITHGYGNIETVVIKSPSLEDALLRLF